MKNGFLNRLASGFVQLLAKISPVVGRASVKEISTRDLQDLLSQNDATSKVILVDVRSQEETGVSIIPSAITVEQFEANKSRYSKHEIVAYCTVGGRSLVYAQKLKTEGFKAVNYRPSILGWCEACLPLVTLDGRATQKVHTYSAKFRVPEQYDATPSTE